LYASTKIVVGDTLCPNFSYPDYWSDRVYETLGRGGFIIHPYISGMEKEFTDKEHLVFYEYKNFKQLKELIDYYLEHDEEREKIRVSGHNLVKEKYTYKNRWEQILKELGI
jgi:spore maturation protein CgeB